MNNQFFAMISRMKLIERWSLMRNSQTENLSEHSLEVSIIAHALAVISRDCLGNEVDVEKVALIGIFHDASEIITGDMPTPIKYFNQDIQKAFQSVERYATHQLFDMLPDYMKESYEGLLFPKEQDAYLWKLVKAADKLSALIKCIEERKAGNTEFIQAEKTIIEALVHMDMEEVNVFMK